MTPFVYPKTRHRRTQSPPQYARYQSYKPFLRVEFGKQCVYCRMPDGPRGADAFGVDHYRPKDRFPALETRYANLFYACNACNSRKRNYWPSTEDDAKGRFIPNPCDHKMSAHLRFDDPRIVGRSVAGKHTIELLDLNDDDVVAARRSIDTALRLARRELRGVLEALAEIEAELHGAPDDRREILESHRQVLEQDKDELENVIRMHASGAE